MAELCALPTWGSVRESFFTVFHCQSTLNPIPNTTSRKHPCSKWLLLVGRRVYVWLSLSTISTNQRLYLPESSWAGSRKVHYEKLSQARKSSHTSTSSDTPCMAPGGEPHTSGGRRFCLTPWETGKRLGAFHFKLPNILTWEWTIMI